MIKIKCKECGQEFMGRKRRKFCSRACYVKDWTKRVPGHNRGKWFKSDCLYCGKEFTNNKKGYVKKDQSYKEMAQDTLGSFIEEHTEYAPENDTEDIRWSRFNTILKEDYNIQGKTQKQLQSIFNKIDRDVKEELGETVTPNKANKTQAQRQKIGSVSAGTSSSSKDVVKPVKIQSASGNRKSIGGVDFKDFDDDDFDEV